MSRSKNTSPKVRNTYVSAMHKRHQNAVQTMHDRRERRPNDKKNHWSNEWNDSSDEEDQERTLREQVINIAISKFNPQFIESISFPEVVKELIIKAFKERWPESVETRAIRKCLILSDVGKEKNCAYKSIDEYQAEEIEAEVE